MPAQYTVGQALPNGSTVAADNFTTQAGGTTVEVMSDTKGNTVVLTVPGPGTSAANQQTILANIATLQGELQSWMTANPGGAVLTAGQTLVLAQMVMALFDIIFAQYSTTQGT